MTEQTGFDVDAIEALALALADVGDMGEVYRAEPPEWEFAPSRLKCARTAQVLLERVRASGYELTKVPR